MPRGYNNDGLAPHAGGYMDCYIYYGAGTSGDYYAYDFILREDDDIRTVMTMLANGKVGIGTTSPTYPLQVHNSVTKTFPVNYIVYGISTTQHVYNVPSSGYTTDISIYTPHGGLWTKRVVASSDKRIKKDIVEIDDDLALQKVRNIQCCTYKYIDNIARGERNQIGFIAQQVKEHCPEAISIQRSIIPNEMRNLQDISWNGTDMTCDLTDVSGIKHRFYVSNDLSGNDAEMKEIVGNEDNTFSFDASYNYVFCYGKEVDDFHTLDKQKLFAINFSATQEIDRIQQAEKAKLAAAEAEIANLKAKNIELETTLTNLLAELRANNIIL